MTTNTTHTGAGAINTNARHTDTNGADFRTGGAIEQATVGIATVGIAIAIQIENLELAGHAVHHIGDGGFLVSKYCYTHHAKDFLGLQAFARRLGVSHEL